MRRGAKSKDVVGRIRRIDEGTKWNVRMDAEGLRRTLLHVKKVGCQLPNIDPERLVVDRDDKLGEGESVTRAKEGNVSDGRG